MGFPRMRGGDPMNKKKFEMALEFSPHARG